jgi:predicted metal-dependent enzyme (double-stranded beta helix superfamily)
MPEVKTNLDRLNELLRKEKIPEFRMTVTSSMNNMKWLRSTLLKTSTNEELRSFLLMDTKTLLSPYAQRI